MTLNETKKPQFFILVFLVSFASVGAVLFTPALPSIASFFQVSIGHAQATITSYLLGYAIGQLPYGPLANRFGRKPALFTGISVSIAGSLLCIFSASIHSFTLLVLARFLQALGACVGLKVSFTMIADSFEQSQATKWISYLMISFAIIPGIAVAVGGGITTWIGWTGCFYFLALFGVLVFCLCMKLPETSRSLDRSALSISSIAEAYKAKFRNHRLVLCGLIMGLGTASIYIFASKAPFIGISAIGLTPYQFGLFNLIPAIGMVLGGFFASKFSSKFPFYSLLLAGIIGCFIVSAATLFLFSFNMINPWILFFSMFLINLGECLIFANVSSFGLMNAKNKSNGSAVLNFINLATGVTGVLFIEFVYPESALLLPLSFLICFSVMFLLWLRLKNTEKIPA